MSTQLSSNALATHNQQLRKPRSQSNPEMRKPSKSPYKHLLENAVKDRSTKADMSKQSDSGSVHSKQSLAAPVRTKRTIRKWKSSKMSSVTLNCADNQLALDNTYKLEPDGETMFNGARTRAVVKDVLEYYLGRFDGYERESVVKLSPLIADQIKIKVKALGFKRYKIVCHVIIGENAGQGFEVASRGVWDTDSDSMVTVTYEKKNLFAVANVFATYFE